MPDLDNKTLLVLSSVLTAALTVTANYFLGIRSKKADLLYQNKLVECKAIVTQLVEFKSYCNMKCSDIQGNEFSNISETGGTINHRNELYKTIELNTFYLSLKSRNLLIDLISEMSLLCNLEILPESEQQELGILHGYLSGIAKTEECITKLRNELN